ncbi:MAG: hypothetical protein ACWGNI_01985 [Desulfobacterales bacterium]
MKLETFTDLKDFVDNPYFHDQRKNYLSRLDIESIDTPIVDLIRGFTKLDYCVTLQSCYGHFLHNDQKDPYNIEPLPVSKSISNVEYKIAYIALCIENSKKGRFIFQHLRNIPLIDPEYVQFGCAEWFWERHVNSYALQVEPIRHMTKDRISVDYSEALHIERVRNIFFAQLKKLIKNLIASRKSNYL